VDGSCDKKRERREHDPGIFPATKHHSKYNRVVPKARLQLQHQTDALEKPYYCSEQPKALFIAGGWMVKA
jgi:hypothetical protein